MPTTTTEAMADNIEEVLCTHYGADEATASLNYDLGDDMFSFDALIEGSLEDIHLTYVVKDSAGWQMIHVRDDKYEDEPAKFRVLYVYITEENAVEHEIEGAELLDLDTEHGVDIEDLLA